jgi:hypothetical protein
MADYDEILNRAVERAITVLKAGTTKLRPGEARRKPQAQETLGEAMAAGEDKSGDDKTKENQKRRPAAPRRGP